MLAIMIKLRRRLSRGHLQAMKGLFLQVLKLSVRRTTC